MSKISQIINFVLLFSLIFLLIFNFYIFRVIHFTTGLIPVLTPFYYSSIEINLVYILIAFISLNILMKYLNWVEKVKEYASKCILILSLILLPIIFLNPHVLILNPRGYPTRLDFLAPAGYILVVLIIIFLSNEVIHIAINYDLKSSSFSFFVILLALFTGEFIHESGHAFFILISGGIITMFFPFPIIMGGELIAGYVSGTGVPNNLIPLVLLGGEFFQWIVLLLGFYLIFRRNFKKKIQLFVNIVILVAWLDYPLYTINNILNLPHWFIIGSSEGDIIQFSMLTGIPLWFMLILAILQLMIGIFLVYIYQKKKTKFIIIKQC